MRPIEEYHINLLHPLGATTGLFDDPLQISAIELKADALLQYLRCLPSADERYPMPDTHAGTGTTEGPLNDGRVRIEPMIGEHECFERVALGCEKTARTFRSIVMIAATFFLI